MSLKVIDPLVKKKPEYFKANDFNVSKLYRCVSSPSGHYNGHILVATCWKDQFGVWMTFDTNGQFSNLTINWQLFEFEEVRGTFTIEKVIHA